MLASEVRKIIAPFLRESPPECGLITLTEVEVTDDCSYATIFVSALQNPETALSFLEEKLPELQKSLLKLERKRLPIIRVRYDDRGERGQRIDMLLNEDQ